MSLASSLGRGQVAALYYAERLLELPLGLVGVCLGMASLPTLSRLAAVRDFSLFSVQLGTALRLTLLLSLPAAAGLWAVGPRLVEGLLRHGAFGDSAAYETALALRAYLPGLPAFAVNRSLLAACNALGEARRTAASAVWAVAATLAVGAALVHSLSGSLGVMDRALQEGVDVLYVDTAGRLQTKVNLMEELSKIRQVLGKKHAGAPHRTILVIDATTGQNALSQTKLFKEAAGIDELIITKLDGTAKGGVAIAVAMQHHLPITYVGLGEKMEDLRPFSGADYARALLGARADA